MWELRRGGMRDEGRDEARRWGLDAAQVAALLAEHTEDGAAPDDDGEDCHAQPGGPLLVWPCNATVLRAWLRLQTQWHLGPTGRMVALRLDAAGLVVARLMRGQPQQLQDDVLEQLQDMETAALEAMHG